MCHHQGIFCYLELSGNDLGTSVLLNTPYSQSQVAVCELPAGKSPVLTLEFRAGESFMRVLAVPGHTKGCANGLPVSEVRFLCDAKSVSLHN